MEPIPVEQFKEHVKSLHRNDDYPFSEEYSVSTYNICIVFNREPLYICTYRMLNQAMPPLLKLPTILTMPPRTDMPIFQHVST